MPRLRYSVPMHVLLGIGFRWFIQHQPDQLVSILFWIHVAFPCLLLLTARWWWNRWGVRSVVRPRFIVDMGGDSSSASRPFGSRRRPTFTA